MKFAYKFQNLLGTVYRKGNLQFTPDGNSVISPVGNRITIYDLKNNKVKSLSLESRFNYTAIDISPNGAILLAVNEIGEAQMISTVSFSVICTHKFSSGVSGLKFSPDGKYFAVCMQNVLFIYKTPGQLTGEYGSFVLKMLFRNAHDDLTCVDWSSDSRVVLVGSKDNCTRIYGVEKFTRFRTVVLGGHTDAIVGGFFEDKSLHMNSVSRNGQLCVWEANLGLKDLVTSDEKAKEPREKRQRQADDDEDEFDEEKDVELEKESAATEVLPEGSAGDDEERDKLGKVIPRQSEATKQDNMKIKYTRVLRFYLADEARKTSPQAVLTASAYHRRTKILVSAFSSGAFFLHELPEVNLIHSLNISDYQIDTATFNNTGDWVALGVAGVGQLLVWEWQSENYVMKQQGHSSDMTCLTYSPDGQFVATGGDDGKVKLWNLHTGFCFATFSDHAAPITAVEFSRNKKFIVSASLDGTVRAFDMMRHRNFRTFTTPQPTQFSSVALDCSGELVAAGSQDVFEIYLWSVKLGKLLEVLSGHEAPVMALAFSPNPTSSTLVSGSWDKTLKVWNCLESTSDHESIDLMSDVVAVAFHPGGEEVAAATLNGNISVFHAKSAQQVALIEGRNDLGSGVSEVDVVTAKKNLQGKCFTTISYSADGDCILAAGKSKNICIYHVKEDMLLRKFEVTQNQSLDGLSDFLNRRNVTEFGNLALVERREPLEGGNVAVRLAGVQHGDMAARSFKPEFRVTCVRFSPTGISWAAACTEGLMVYALDKGIVFDPYHLSQEVTPKATRELLQRQEFSRALIMALKLNETPLIHQVIESVPLKDVKLVVKSLPEEFGERLGEIVAQLLTNTPHVQFHLQWACEVITFFGPKENVLPHHALLALHQSLSRKYETLSKVCDFNRYTIRVLKSVADARVAAEQEVPVSEDDEMMMSMAEREAEDVEEDEIADEEDEEEI
ncbi:periodic tryptophan protein 2 homolog isoform X2 [Phlebotomus argentipes]|uniref:periodic tryptophan protein 2 homolog isoform X2 n=1 Tax=Phlebotomus argentipes TaxID=94469 RepID=UPI002892E945|nr:periodic tryptophan protein 2 homolog isoform X2 [Phlebotomus argentipes]